MNLFSEAAMEGKPMEASKETADRLELPDDSGDKKYASELPDDSGKLFGDPGKKILPAAERTDGVQEGGCLSTYKERLNQTPNETSGRGYWTGERGRSVFIPASKEIKDILKQYGLEGISYQDAIPDFSKCSACTIEIDNMTERRIGAGGNFDQCDHNCADQWNKECRDGRNDWTAGDIRAWREANGYSWHERNDMKTCDLIPTKVNDYFGHFGGVGECRKRDAITDGGEFDE